MTITSCKVYQTTFCDDIDSVSVLKSISYDILSGWFYLNCHLSKTCYIHLTIKVSSITADCSVLHCKEVLLHDDSVTSCYCHEDISKRSCLLHLHYLEAVHYSLHCLDRIHLGNDYLCTKTLCTHCHTFTTPAVACHNDILSCNDKVCSAVDTIPYRLACSVTVIEKVLTVSIVDKHHRESQLFSFIELNESQDTSRCLFAASDHVRDKISIFCMHKIHEITTIVDDDMWTNLKNSSDMSLVLLWSCIIPSENVKSSLNKSCCNIVLSRKRVASCNVHLRSSSCKNLA